MQKPELRLYILAVEAKRPSDNTDFSLIVKKDIMGAIVIKSSNNKNLRLLSELAKQLGETVDKLTPAQAEDIELGRIMKKEKTGISVSRKSIFKHLDS